MGTRFRLGVALSAALVSSAFVVGAAVMPDVTIKQKTEVKLGGTLGDAARFLGLNKPITTTTRLKGDVLRIDEDETTDIIDLEREVFIKIDHDERRYSVKTFEEWRREWEEAREGMEGEGEGDAEEYEGDESTVVTTFDVSIERTGETRKIKGYESQEVVVRLTVEAEDTATGELNKIITTSNVWLAEDLEGYGELQEFYRRLGEKLGRPWEVSLQNLGDLLMQSNPEAAESLKELKERSAELEGTPLLTITRIEVKSSGAGEGEEDEGEEEGGGVVGRAIGGLFGKKDKDEDEEALVLEIKTEVKEYSTDGLSVEVFQVRDDYEEVGSD